MNQQALEEYKLCVQRQIASQGRMWPMASVLLIFSLGGLALLGREAATDWQTLALVGIAGVVSVVLLWVWRIADWNETYWEEAIYERMWELEGRLGFLTNLTIHFLLVPEPDLPNDPYWKNLDEDERTFVKGFRRSHKRPPRLRHLFNSIAAVGTFGWIGLFALRLAEFLTTG